MKNVLTAAVLMLAATTVSAQAPRGAAAVEPELGVLAPSNLAKPRPKPPFNLTGRWFVDLNFPGFWRFGPPYPKLTPAAQVGSSIITTGSIPAFRRATRSTSSNGSAWSAPTAPSSRSNIR